MKSFGRAHAEPAKGDQASNIKYCSKEEGRLEPTVEYGVKMTPGNKSKNTGIKRCLDHIAAGMTIADISKHEGETFVKHFKGIERVSQLQKPKREWKTVVHVYWGKAGTGKSFKARHDYPNAWYMPRNSTNTTWFDGYDGQENVIMDEFYGWIPLQNMLEYMDETPITVPIKGSHVNWLCKNLILTSNAAPENWYAAAFLKNAEHKIAFMRRIENVLEFTAFKTFKLSHPKRDHDLAMMTTNMLIDDRNVSINEDGILINLQQEEEKQNQIASAFTTCSICADDISICQGQCIRQLGESPQPTVEQVIQLTALMSMRMPVSLSEHFYCSESLDGLTIEEKDKEEKRRWDIANQMYEENGNGFKVRGVCGTQLDRKYVCKSLLVL